MKSVLFILGFCLGLNSFAQFEPPLLIQEFSTHLQHVTDLDGNGLYDLICDEGIILNQALDGGTLRPNPYNISWSPRDFNNDGYFDFISNNTLYLSNEEAEIVEVYNFLGLGHGTSDDLDGDGDVDVLSEGDHWYENLGNAQFVFHDNVFESTDFRIVGDLDLDGLPDVLSWSYFGYLTWNRNIGGGQFAPGIEILELDNDIFSDQSKMALLDIDGDGDQDLIFNEINGIVRWAENDGTNVFVDIDPWFGDAHSDFCIVDFDVDGDDDLLIVDAAGSGAVLYCENDNGIGFPQDLWVPGSETGGYWMLKCFDADSDGLPDLFAETDQTQTTDYLKNEGSWEVSRQMPALQDPGGLTAFRCGDVNGDGIADLQFWGSYNTNHGYAIACLYQLDELEFSSLHYTDHMYEEGGYEKLEVGFLNNDGYLDAVHRIDYGLVEVWLSQENGVLELSQSFTNYSDVIGSTVADMDGDGDEDIFIDNGGNCDSWYPLLINDGQGMFDLGPNTNLCQDDLYPVDIDLDGDMDFFHQNGFFLQNPDFEFSFFPLDGLTTRQYHDIDEDGLPDVIGFGDNNVSVSRNLGNGVFGDLEEVFPVGSDYVNSILVVDHDVDNDLDLLLNTDGGLVLKTNLGAGIFDNGININYEFGGTMRAGDVDSDGDDDILLKAGDKIYVLINTTIDIPIIIDFNDDMIISIEDLLFLLGAFGCQGECVGDLNGDGLVNVMDLLEFLTLFP